MLETQLQELKEDMNSSIFKDVEFSKKQRSIVLSKLDRKHKKHLNLKIFFTSAFAVLIFSVLLLSTIQLKSENIIDQTAGSNFFPLELNEQLITDAKKGIFSPVPSVSYNMSLNEVKGILGNPFSVIKPSQIDTVLHYGEFYLLFIEQRLKFIGVTNITNVKKDDLIKLFGKPDYENYNEQRGYGLVTFSVGDSIYNRWHFNCFVDIKDKNTIKDIQFSKDVIRFGSSFVN